ncbi:MAG: PilZ domain-containing protein [Chrysiogenia bacterium]
MEKRKELRIRKRILSSLEEKPAIVVDMSLSGIKISMSRPPRTQTVDIKLQVGEKVINLKGDVRWITRMVSNQVSNNIGIVIREAPPEYYEMLTISD